MKAEKLIQVSEFIRQSDEYLSGKIDFTADVIDLKSDKVYGYHLSVFSTEANTAFFHMQLAAFIETEFKVATYCRINSIKGNITLEVI